MRRLLPVALSLLAVVSLVTPARAERVVWAPCPGALECTTLSVPLDYAHPDQGTIAVVVSRRQAADPAHRKGVLLINPGGPGGTTPGTPPVTWTRSVPP